MTTVLERVVEDLDTRPEEKLVEQTHLVCHCSDFNIAACGLDVTGMELIEGVKGSADDCPLCMLAWPDDKPCPWGCSCWECLV